MDGKGIWKERTQEKERKGRKVRTGGKDGGQEIKKEKREG